MVLGRHLGGGEVVMIRNKSKPVSKQYLNQSLSSDYLQNIFFKPSLTTRDYYLNDNPKCIVEGLGS